MQVPTAGGAHIHQSPSPRFVTIRVPSASKKEHWENTNEYVTKGVSLSQKKSLYKEFISWMGRGSPTQALYTLIRDSDIMMHGMDGISDTNSAEEMASVQTPLS